MDTPIIAFLATTCPSLVEAAVDGPVAEEEVSAVNEVVVVAGDELDDSSGRKGGDEITTGVEAVLATDSEGVSCCDVEADVGASVCVSAAVEATVPSALVSELRATDEAVLRTRVVEVVSAMLPVLVFPVVVLPPPSAF